MLKKILKYTLLFLFAVIIGALVFGQVYYDLSFNIPELMYNTRDIKTAKANYQDKCVSCHASSAEEFVDRKWLCGFSYAEVFKSIEMGCERAEHHDFGKELSQEEIHGLTALINEAHEQKVAGDIGAGAGDWSGIIESEELTFWLDTVVNGKLFENPEDFQVPWGMAFLPGGELLVTERSGRLFKFQGKQLLGGVQGIPEVVNNEIHGGLLDVEAHPDFESNNLIFLSYAKYGKGGRTTAVMRAKLVGLELKEQEEIFEALPYVNTDKEYGSRLQFDNKGHLYVSIGNRNAQSLLPENGMKAPQNLENDIGRIHRINIDGTPIDDNPFIGESDARKTIYSYGHRNPQGMTLNPYTGELWTSEHGPRGGDELNLIEKGKNYGWPVVSHGLWYTGQRISEDVEAQRMESPDYYWFPSIAPCGMDFISGERYPEWKGDLLVASLKFQHVARMKMDGDTIVGEERLLNMIGRVRDIQMGSDGYIYIAVEKPGAIYRIVPMEEQSPN